MISMKRPMTTLRVPVLDAGQRILVMHAAAIAIIVGLTFFAYAMFDRALHVAQNSTNAAGLTAQARRLTARIAGLAGQYALGDHGARRELLAAGSTLEATERTLVGGDPARGIRPAAADAALKALYFGGSISLDAAIEDFLTQARQLAARRPQDPNGLMLGRTLFRSADGALDAQLSEAQRLREATGWNELVRLRTFGLGAVIALLGTMLVEMFGIVRPLVRVTAQLAREVAELKRVATTDPVTGTLNRRSFQDRGAIEVQKARRYKRPLSLLMIDTDQLRPINLAHGEAAGEVILRAVTAELSEGTRATDLIARVSGEEFAILLPETDLAGAQLLAERLRRRVSDVTVPVAKDVVACTVSIGVAAVEKDAAFLWPAVKRADEALYEAKMRGRNQVYVNAA